MSKKETYTITIPYGYFKDVIAHFNRVDHLFNITREDIEKIDHYKYKRPETILEEILDGKLDCDFDVQSDGTSFIRIILIKEGD